MKIEQLIVQYLYLNKQVTLQGIGTFRLDPAVILPAPNEKEKDFTMPENAVQFEYNLKAGEDEGLVKYIVQHTRKILPLASSDLESYSMLAKQFLNIGKPLVIEGVGTVQKSQQGNYQFIPGVFITPKIGDIPKQEREVRDETVSFETAPRVDHSRRNLMRFIIVVVIVLVGLGVYYFVAVRNTFVPVEIPGRAGPVIDTSKKDTIAKTVIDTTPTVTAVIPNNDSINFKVVIKKFTNPAAAQNTYTRLTAYGHKLEVLTDDSIYYELAMPFTAPISDTLRIKDSLQKFFGGFPYIKFDKF